MTVGLIGGFFTNRIDRSTSILTLVSFSIYLLHTMKREDMYFADIFISLALRRVEDSVDLDTIYRVRLSFIWTVLYYELALGVFGKEFSFDCITAYSQLLWT